MWAFSLPFCCIFFCFLFVKDPWACMSSEFWWHTFWRFRPRNIHQETTRSHINSALQRRTHQWGDKCPEWPHEREITAPAWPHTCDRGHNHTWIADGNGPLACEKDRVGKTPLGPLPKEEVSYWILMSCRQHRDTAGRHQNGNGIWLAGSVVFDCAASRRHPGEELWKQKWRTWTTAGAPSRVWPVTDMGGVSILRIGFHYTSNEELVLY